MYKSLRHLRRLLSVIVLVLLTYAVADSVFALTHLGSWLIEVQLIPAILGSAGVWVVVWVVLTLCLGRVYCSSFCPMGTIQDMAGYVGLRLRPDHRYHYMPPADWLRIPIGVIVAVCLLWGINAIVEGTDPYTRYAQIVVAITRPLTIGVGGLIVAGCVLVGVTALGYSRGRLLCNTLCPVGAFLALVSRRAIYSIDINTDKCIHCNKCRDICKSSCIKMPDCTVDNSRCVVCLDCTAVCPNGAITMRRGKHQLSIPMMQKVSDATSQNLTTTNQLTTND